MPEQEVREEVDRLAEAGDEAALKKFLLDNFKDLPEQLQRKLLFAFFADAVEDQAGRVAVTKLQAEALDALDKLEELKKSLGSKE